MSAAVPAVPATRAGYVAIIGLPNVGKSTLLNRFVGEHLSIATPKAQTTWQRVTGIVTAGSTQLIFLDTPGLLEARDLFQHAMRAAALEALAEADIVLVVLDVSREPAQGERERMAAALGSVRVPLHVALNKIDREIPDSSKSWQEWAAGLPGVRVHPISALDGAGTDELLESLRADLPQGPFLYPEDEIASDPVRFFVAELVRETIFEQYHQEIPYSVFCEVTEFREEQDPVYIGIDIHVEKQSQKGIVIGKRGAAIRELGSAARVKIEHLLGRSVYLDLWVKPLESWRKSRTQLGRLGFRLPAENEGTR